MPTIALGEGQNVRVTQLIRARSALIALLLTPALVLSGCGTGDDDKPKAEPSADQPTVTVDVPDDVTLTKAGTTLAFREPALVAYEPNPQRGTVLSLSVDSVQAARIGDFAAYQLDDRTKKSRPYYVRVSVKNLGTGDLSRMAVPIYAVDQDDTLIQQSTFNNSFATCPSLPLPAGFGGGKSMQGCLVYFVPNGGTLKAMSYRPLQAFPAITWEGAVLPPAVTKKDKKNKKRAKP
jgi:PBP1b-binding outer membrane lipoprotein LpoB